MAETAKIIQFPDQKKKQAATVGGTLTLSGIAGAVVYYMASPIVSTIGILLILSILAGVSFALIVLTIYLLIGSNKNRSEIAELKSEILDEKKLTSEIYLALEKLPYAKLIEPKLTVNSFELYIAYKQLTVSHMSAILNNIDKLYKWTYALNTNIWDSEDHINNNEKSYIEVWNKIEERLKAHPEDRFVLHFAQTGDSIKFQLKSGWSPTIGADEGDIVISLPKGVLTIGVLATIITTAYNQGISGFNETLDAAIKVNQLQTQELMNEKLRLENKKLMLEIKKISETFNKIPGKDRKEIEKDFKEYIYTTIGNKEITTVKVTPGIYRRKA